MSEFYDALRNVMWYLKHADASHTYCEQNIVGRDGSYIDTVPDQTYYNLLANVTEALVHCDTSSLNPRKKRIRANFAD